jgi:hypothetical protein
MKDQKEEFVIVALAAKGTDIPRTSLNVSLSPRPNFRADKSDICVNEHGRLQMKVCVRACVRACVCVGIRVCAWVYVCVQFT